MTLHAGVEGGCLEVVKRLVDVGADVEVGSENNRQPAAQVAVTMDHGNILDSLEAAGTTVPQQSTTCNSRRVIESLWD